MAGKRGGNLPIKRKFSFSVFSKNFNITSNTIKKKKKKSAMIYMYIYILIMPWYILLKFIPSKCIFECELPKTIGPPLPIVPFFPSLQPSNRLDRVKILWFEAFYILVNKVTLFSPMFGLNGIISVVLRKQNLINFVGKDLDVNNIQYIFSVIVGF